MHVFKRDADYSSLIASQFLLGDFDIFLQFLRGQFQAEIVIDIRVRRDIRLLLFRDRRESLEGDVLRLGPRSGEDLAGVYRTVVIRLVGELHLDIVEAASPRLRQYR